MLLARHFSSTNAEVALAGRAGLMTAVRRGEAPILAFRGKLCVDHDDRDGRPLWLCLGRSSSVLED